MALVLPTFTTATLPSASANKNALVTVTDGADGKLCVAMSNGTAWLRLTLGTAVSSKPLAPAKTTVVDFSRTLK